ncbi:hypothetical protein [Thermoactinomyces vulgaris]|uniref:hypothetical protein n=1 Tax=Thermoactinomyces vulgaris TaxID=2026 RepID=UPI0036323B89
MSGWIKLHRKILKSDMWRNLNSAQRDVAITILLMASYDEGEAETEEGIIKTKPGQCFCSLETIREKCAKDVTIQNVRTALKKLEKWGFITNESSKKGRIITVVNWDLYQTPRQEKTTQKRQRKNENFPETPQKNDGENTQEIQQYQGLPPSGDDKKRHESDAETTQKHTNNNDNNENKYNPRKRAKRIYDDDSPYMKMAIYFKDRVLSWKPNAKVPNDLNKWADDFRKLHELDKRTKQEIKDVIDWATSDSFWQANILSPGKLRKQFDTLQAQMSRKVIKMPEKPMSYWEEKQRREEELERKRLAERDKQMKVQRFIEETGLHPMKHPDLLRDYLEGRVSLAELKERKWGS